MDFQLEKDNFEKYFLLKSDQVFPGGPVLNEAIRYSLLAPAKRIRPLLCLGFSRGFKGERNLALPSAMAVEMIHSYSLIHDDLPAMDNDDYRRGRPTNHKVYGEAMAILAGDALLNMAPEFLLRELCREGMIPSRTIELTAMLMGASGHQGMIKGQALDMHYESQDFSGQNPKELGNILKTIHRHKTGAIITWSCLAGLYTHKDEAFIQKHSTEVESTGQAIGLLFQIVDDVLDVTSSLKELGKTPGKDQAAGKLTYTGLHGLPETVRLGKEIVEQIRLQTETFTRATQGDWSIINEIVASLDQKLT